MVNTVAPNPPPTVNTPVTHEPEPTEPDPATLGRPPNEVARMVNVLPRPEEPPHE